MPQSELLQTSVCYVVSDVGRYHNARLQTAAAKTGTGGVTVVEISNRSGFPAFSHPSREKCSYRRETLFPGQAYGQIRPGQIRRVLLSMLSSLKPRAIAIPGWSAPDALAGLAWALSNSVPAIVLSDSQYRDHKRKGLGETIKRRLVSLCSAALVGGRSHAEYVAELGLPRERVFTGYDVVDNEHFIQGAAKARRDASCRSRISLPEHYFLTSCRFVPEKNLPRLLAAYARYRKAAPNAWDLVLVGDGPLREQIQASISRLGLESSVHLAGFRQYAALPAYYGLAQAFILSSVSETWGLAVNEAMASGLPVLVSRHCGCAPDLVKEGRNGWTFDPLDVDGLSKLMVRMSALTREQRVAMGRSSQKIIARWSPETFAENLWRAVEAALAAPRPKPSALDQALLWLLMHR